MGAQLSIASGPHHANLTGAGLSRDLPLLLETLADELTNPAFPDSELAKAKLEMRAGVLQNFDNTAQRAIDRATQIAFPEGHPYRAATKDEMIAHCVHVGRSQFSCACRTKSLRSKLRAPRGQGRVGVSMRIPAAPGHSFRRDLGTDSGLTWALVPEHLGTDSGAPGHSLRSI